MSSDLKHFISFKDIKEGIVVNGFIDEKSFCGNFEIRLANGKKVVKQGVFKKIHTFPKENFIMDFTKYVDK